MADNDDQPSSRPADDLLQDPMLRNAPTVEGYKVLEPAVLYAKIGKGGMGAVYRGRHFKLDLDVAVKCLKPSLVDEDGDFVKRFEREARLAASIAHQNVVRVMDVQEQNGLHYLVMEYVRGETAAERVARKGPLSEREALAILYGATAGLAEAHQRGIVHRDIKPENILVSVEGRVKLADLGLAKSSGGVDGRSVSMPASRIMGTPQYMPPEQWETTDVTAAADIWALGATFYFLVTGKAGIPGTGTYHAVAKRIQEQDYPTLRAARSDLRPEVHAIFEKCVQRDWKDRYPDARMLLRELKKLAIDDEEVLLDPETGTGIARAGVVTPPPRQTLLRIRAQIETVVTGKQTEAEPAGGFAPKSEGATIPSAPVAGMSPPAPLPQSTARLWLLIAGGLAVWNAMGFFHHVLASGFFEVPAFLGVVVPKALLVTAAMWLFVWGVSFFVRPTFRGVLIAMAVLCYGLPNIESFDGMIAFELSVDYLAMRGWIEMAICFGFGLSGFLIAMIVGFRTSGVIGSICRWLSFALLPLGGYLAVTWGNFGYWENRLGVATLCGIWLALGLATTVLAFERLSKFSSRAGCVCLGFGAIAVPFIHPKLLSLYCLFQGAVFVWLASGWVGSRQRTSG